MTDKRPTYDEFFKAYAEIQERVERFALYLTHRRDSAAELVSESVLACALRFHDVRDSKALLSFIFTMMLRLHHASRRRSQRQVPHEPEAFDMMIGEQMSPDTQADIRILNDAMNLLPDAWRETLILAYIFDLPLSDVARIRKTSVGAVKMVLARAKQRLNKMLVEETANEQ
ncbi:MAG: sigma-70 family RNA polymerase sigma factor [bacterium]|nr:sigma-70 family RNA polymerase sigma factor [bacterium]